MGLVSSGQLRFFRTHQTIHSKHSGSFLKHNCSWYFSLQDVKRLSLQGSQEWIPCKTSVSTLQKKRYSVFLLGGAEGIAEKTKEKLEELYKNIDIVGTYAGRPFTDDDETIFETINNTQPQILFVAFGTPKQEQWIYENLKKLPSVKIAMGIGGAFDFISGHVKRAPIPFQKMGIEWLWRLFQEPRKRIPRIWNAVIVFPLKILGYKLRNS